MTANFRLASMQLENLRAMENLLKCGLCGNLLQNPYSTDCEHHFCKTCIDDALFSHSKCPTCGLPMHPRDLARNPTFCNIVGSVSKLRAAINRLEARRKTKALDPKLREAAASPTKRAKSDDAGDADNADRLGPAEDSADPAQDVTMQEARSSDVVDVVMQDADEQAPVKKQAPERAEGGHKEGTLTEKVTRQPRLEEAESAPEMETSTKAAAADDQSESKTDAVMQEVRDVSESPVPPTQFGKDGAGALESATQEADDLGADSLGAAAPDPKHESGAGKPVDASAVSGALAAAQERFRKRQARLVGASALSAAAPSEAAPAFEESRRKFQARKDRFTEYNLQVDMKTVSEPEAALAARPSTPPGTVIRPPETRQESPAAASSAAARSPLEGTLEAEAPTQPERPCIIVTGLDGEDLDRCIEWIERLGGEYLHKFEFESPKLHVSHVIVKPLGVNAAGETEVKASPKYLYGLVHGTELVSPEWIEACNAAGKWVDEDPYRIKHASDVLTVKIRAGEIADRTMLGQFDYIYAMNPVHRPIVATWFARYPSVTTRDMCYLHPLLSQKADSLHELVPHAQARDLLDDFPDKSRMLVILVNRCPQHGAPSHSIKTCTYCVNSHRLKSHFERSVLIDPKKVLMSFVRNRPLRPAKPSQLFLKRQGKRFAWPDPVVIPPRRRGALENA